MASIQKKNEAFYCQFIYQGKRHTVTVGKVSDEEAETFAGNVDYLLMRLKQRLLQVPPGVHITDFVIHNGNVPENVEPRQTETVTFEQVKEQYLRTHGNGAMEANSLATVKIHLGHVEKTLGGQFPIQGLTLGDLQRHVDRRTRCKGFNKKRISPTTIRKEVASFRSCWNWAALTGLVKGQFPNRGLVYAKTDEKPPFQTWKEIQQKIAHSGLKAAEVRELWDCLFLTKSDIADLLGFVKENSSQPFLYPMICMAAHTGARRSELLRCKISDLDFASGTVVIHEKKRSRAQRTTRRVPISSFLAEVLKDWLTRHPGGQVLFTQNTKIIRSKTRRIAPTPVTRDEAHDHFKRTLGDSKWKVLRGFHVLRHSFCSVLAMQGVDQRVIDEFMGHQTEEQQKRYRHLAPDVKRAAIDDVFSAQA